MPTSALGSLQLMDTQPARLIGRPGVGRQNGQRSSFMRSSLGSSGLDWDRIRVFHIVAEAGSFTRAGEDLGLSQSAVSRQISSLERELEVPLFHRHGRGLLLTEHGEHLLGAARDMKMRLEGTCARLAETSERAEGDLKVTTTVGVGALWLSQRIGEFLDLYPEIRVELVVTNEDLDLAMREAHVALRLRQPTQADLIQRRLFTVHFHAYASPDYIRRFGEPMSLEDLDHHRLVAFGGDQPAYLQAAHWLATASREPNEPRPYRFVTNTHLALKPALEAGAGIGVLPDYATQGSGLVPVLREIEMPSLESYLVYPAEMRSVARVQAFRDFLVVKAQRWTY